MLNTELMAARVAELRHESRLAGIGIPSTGERARLLTTWRRITRRYR